jgi:hypothetical protein
MDSTDDGAELTSWFQYETTRARIYAMAVAGGRGRVAGGGVGAYQCGQLSKLGQDHDVGEWPSCGLHQRQSAAHSHHGCSKQHLDSDSVRADTRHGEGGEEEEERTYLDRWISACLVSRAWAGRGGRAK